MNAHIDLDDYIHQFDKDLWGVSDAHAQAERDLDKYLDALIAYTKLNVIVSNRNGFSDDDVDYIESTADDAMTNNVDKVTDITWYVML